MTDEDVEKMNAVVDELMDVLEKHFGEDGKRSSSALGLVVGAACVTTQSPAPLMVVLNEAITMMNEYGMDASIETRQISEEPRQ